MKTLKIKDICDKGSSALRQKDVEGKEGKYPVFGASGYISSIDTYHQDKDYIAIVKDGSGIGRVTFMPAYSSVIGTMQYILPKEGYNIKYISYCLQSLDLAKYKQGAAIPHIYFRDYGERYVNIEESLPEQERIVSLLDAEFAKIDAIKANAEKQLQDAKALFQSALKDYLTPKEEGKYKQIKDVCDKESSTLKQKDVEGKEGKYPVFGASGYISSIDTYHQDKDYIAIVKDGSGIGRVTFMPAYSSVIGTMQYILPKEGYNIKYISYCLQSLDLAKYKQGAAIPHIYFRDYGERYVNIEESLPEQERIVALLDKISAKVQSLQSNFDTTVTLCNDLKQSILKDIFG